VHAGQFDVFHDGGHEGVLPVGDRVGLALDGVVEKLVDQDRPVRGHAHGVPHVAAEHLLVMHHLHAAASQDVGRTDHERKVQLLRNGEGLVDVNGHPGGRHGDLESLHHLPEPVAVLGQVDRVDRGAQDLHPPLGQLARDVERRLASELDDDALGSLLLVDRQDVLHREGFEVELVGRVVIRGDRLGVAVDHDGLHARIAQREGGMDATVVELDPLPDPVRAAPEDHHLAAGRYGDLVRRVVGGIVVGRILDARDGNGVPARNDTQGDPSLSHGLLRHAQDPGQVTVRKPVLLGLDEELIGELLSLRLQNGFLEFHQFLHLFDEPLLDVRFPAELVHVGALAQGLVQDELPVARRLGQHGQELGQALAAKVLGEAEAVPPVLERADRLLEGLLVVLADAHHLADRAHLRATSPPRSRPRACICPACPPASRGSRRASSRRPAATKQRRWGNRWPWRPKRRSGRCGD